MKLYIHQQPGWPRLEWREEELTDKLAEVHYLQGQLVGRMAALDLLLRQEATLDTLISLVMKSSESKNEFLKVEKVRQAIRCRLGLDIGILSSVGPVGRNVEGIVELMLDATQNYSLPLTAERLLGWHFNLFRRRHSNNQQIAVGSWRSCPSRISSKDQKTGLEKVYFEAPPAERVKAEMQVFLEWFNKSLDVDPVLKAGLAHLWFVSIHPFDSGNGRIAWAIREMSLARSDDTPQRLYGMSSQIRQEQTDYENALERAVKGTTDVTEWMTWFLGCLGRAIENAEGNLDAVLAKARFRERIAGVPVNNRQNIVIDRLLDGFHGKLTLPKYARVTKCSQEVAAEDIAQMVNHGILAQTDERGRNPGYNLVNAGVIH